VQRHPAGQRLGFGEGGERVDEDSVVLAEDQGRRSRVERQRRPERAWPLTDQSLLRRVKILTLSGGVISLGSSL